MNHKYLIVEKTYEIHQSSPSLREIVISILYNIHTCTTILIEQHMYYRIELLIAICYKFHNGQDLILSEVSLMASRS
jgi:hypothetical protein